MSKNIEINSKHPKKFDIIDGTLVSICIVIENNTNEDADVISKISLPDEWSILAISSSSIFIKKGAKTLDIFAINIPRNAAAKEYKIKYALKTNKKDPAPLEFTANVLANKNIDASILYYPKVLLEGEDYLVKVQIKNAGNIKTKFDLEVFQSNYPLSIDSPTTIELKPSEIKVIDINVQQNKKIQSKSKHMIGIDIKVNDETTLYDKRLIAESEIFPRKLHSTEYKCFLFNTLFGFGLRDNKQEYFNELSGHKAWDKKELRKLVFFLRVPLYRNAQIAKTLGGKPEKYYLNYLSPNLELLMGENLYKLSPLLMAFNLGRGASLLYKGKNIDFMTFFINNSFFNRVLRKNCLGGFLSFKLSSKAFLSGNYLYTNYIKQSQKIIDQPKRNFSYSVRSNLKGTKIKELDLEYAQTTTNGKAQNALYLRSRGNIKKPWYGISIIYADPKFNGYYSDMKVFNGSLGVDLSKRLSLSGSHNIYYTNLNKNLIKDSALRDHRTWIRLSSHLKYDILATLALNQEKSKNAISNEGYKLHFLNFFLSKNFKKTNIQLNLEKGIYKSKFENNKNRDWRNIQIFLSFYPNNNLNYSTYTKLGNVFEQDILVSSQIFGLSFHYRLQKYFKAFLTYEFSNNTRKTNSQLSQQIKKNWIRHFISGQLKWKIFKNHELSIKGRFNPPTSVKQKHEFLLTYSISWNTPYKKKRRTGIKGRIHRNNKPLTHFKVLCDNEQTITDANGEFIFDNLKEGNSLIATEDIYTGMTTNCSMPLDVKVRKGKFSEVEIEMLKGGKVSGNISFYKTIDNKSILNNEGLDENLKESYLYEKDFGAADIIVQIESENEKDIYIETTTKNGKFEFTNLREEKWTLIFIPKNLHNNYQLKDKKFSFEITSGEIKTFEARILPQIRRFQIIEVDTISN